MATTTSLGSELTVNQVDFLLETPCRLNIKKRIEEIVYRSQSSQDRINIAFVQGEELNSDDDLHIFDRSGSLASNKLVTSEISKKDAWILNLTTSNFIITNIFTMATPTKPSTPLFYKHNLFYFNPDCDDWGTTTLTSVSFLNSDMSTVVISNTIRHDSLGVIYNNLANSYDDEAEEATVYFVQYTVKSSAGGSTTYTEVLNNEKIFQQASWDDLDAWGNLLPTCQAYLIESVLGGDSFTVTLPTYDTYAWTETSGARLELLSPVTVSIENPWHVRVRNGDLIASLMSNVSGGVSFWKNYRFYIPEFDTQVFTPFPPYKLLQDQEGIWINKQLIKVSRGPIVDTSLAMHITILDPCLQERTFRSPRVRY